MARSLRILFEGAYYHVINRGQGKREVFCDRMDYQNFLDILSEACQVYGAKIVAYCLMGNHYHLLVKTPKGNLSDFMRHVNGVYTQRFNKRYKQDGSLFKGRYKSVVVQEGSYLLRLIRYIHNNPVRSGIVKFANGYLYSSHKAFLSGKESNWLRFKDTLKTQWKREKDLIRAYREYMKKDDEVVDEYLRDKSKQAARAIIYGDEGYKDKIKMTYLGAKRLYGEVPEGRRAKDEIAVRIIKREVAKEFKIGEDELLRSRRGRENTARMMALVLARESSGYRHRELGQLFGGISYKSVSSNYDRFKKRCRENKELKRLFERIRSRCSQEET